ncbi:MAG: metallophosphoesterase [Halobacteriovoraceae bacterium]|nr:metallophosphoesterase [Halobacteriovoraceae bacterium]MCB9095501.1 metallophosphoesterase [Halobacteriovoraceae bacterium]
MVKLAFFSFLFSFINHTFSQDSNPFQTRYSKRNTVYALGDIHGNFELVKRALLTGKLVDKKLNWTGGKATFVQVGDILDRGDDEKKIIDFFEKLTTQAQKAGGEVIILNGNHEVMNVSLDFRSTGPRGFKNFRHFYRTRIHDSEIEHIDSVPRSQRGRIVAFRPGGPYAKILAKRNSILILGETLYVHGGVSLEDIDYGLNNINRDISEWMSGKKIFEIPEIKKRYPITQGNILPVEIQSSLLNREYSLIESDLPQEDLRCQKLQRILDRLNLKRMVVAHTVQYDVITSTCDKKIWRIDTGLWGVDLVKESPIQLKQSRAAKNEKYKVKILKIIDDQEPQIIVED